MQIAKNTAESRKILHDLVPLNSLTPERFTELSDKIIIEVVKAGHYLFRKGDRDNQTIFLLEGTVNLIDGFRKVAGEIRAGTEQGLHPISNLQPRQYAARAVTRSVIAKVDSGLLDVFLTWDPSSAAEVADIGSVDSTDWMTRMLQSKAFVKLPPSMLQALLMRFKPVEVKKGQVIIAQGSEGDHFYTIHEGRCIVTRRDAPDAPERKLAELASGDSFGEDALVSESRRNASITMLTDGLLMCLAKDDFVDLLKTQLVKYIEFGDAIRLVEEGAVWVDVRTPDEYECGSFEDSVNIPLAALRGEIPELVYNAKYVICCDTGSRSDSAAFMLSHRGFDVYVLKGGMAGLEQVEEEVDDDGDRVADFTASGAGNAAAAASLLAELEEERQARQSVFEQLDTARGELAEAGEKLASYYGRVKQLEDEKLQYSLRLTEMHERHAAQLQAISEELEQEKMQVHSLRKQIGQLQLERDALRKEIGSEREQSEDQYQQLRGQLDVAQSRIAELERSRHADIAMWDMGTAGGGNSGQEIGAARDRMQAELGDTRAEAVRLRDILRAIASERQHMDGQLQALTSALDSMRDSMHRFAGNLNEVIPAEGRGIEE